MPKAVEGWEADRAECPLCRERFFRPIGTVLAGEVVQCHSCGLGRALRDAPGNFDAEPYTDRFFEEFMSDEFASMRNVALTLHLDEIERLGPSGRRLLDVGAAIGDFVRLAEARGWDVTGIEPAQPAVELARSRGINLVQGTLDDTILVKGSFHAVHLSHVVEHLPDPFAVLRRIRELLAPGGIIAVEVPNELDNLFRSVRRLIRRSGATDLLASEHLWFFTPSTIVRALTGAGFDVASLRTRNWTPLSSRLPLGGLVKRAVDGASVRFRRGELIEVYGKVETS